MKFYRNSDIFFQENALESVVCETAFILSRPQCVNNGCGVSMLELIHVSIEAPRVS